MECKGLWHFTNWKSAVVEINLTQKIQVYKLWYNSKWVQNLTNSENEVYDQLTLLFSSVAFTINLHYLLLQNANNWTSFYYNVNVRNNALENIVYRKMCYLNSKE